MIERPILFSAPMVRAILDGSKTQNRRVVKANLLPIVEASLKANGRVCLEMLDTDLVSPYGVPGDRLWVKEGFFVNHWPYPKSKSMIAKVMAEDSGYMYYRADGDPDFEGEDHNRFWTPSPQMPRWASRILLEITEVRVQRLQDISRDDIIAEGCIEWEGQPVSGMVAGFHQPFATLWESINGPESWEANQWVWAISFKRVTG